MRNQICNNKIICAIDTNDFLQATNLIDEIFSEIQTIKLGLEFFMAFGMDGVKRIIDLKPEIKIFLDLKFHDIPNTVFGALRSVVTIPNIFLTTVHASGGEEMIRKAKDIVQDSNSNSNSNSRLKIIAVTRLTSLKPDLKETLRLTELALRGGADGIVCAAELCREIRAKFEKDNLNLIIVTPGIRLPLSDKGTDTNLDQDPLPMGGKEILDQDPLPMGGKEILDQDPLPMDLDDQKAISTPKQAILNGSDYLVIGRPITQSKDKARTIRDILGDIELVS